MPDQNLHLRVTRSMPTTPRRTSGGGPRVPVPDDPRAHAARLEAEVDAAIQLAPPAAAFDPRLLLKLSISNIDPFELEYDGFEVVSQEESTIAVLFANEESLKTFKRRLAVVKSGEKVTRADIIYAINRVDVWSGADRRGAALTVEGLPDGEAEPVVDVELWPLDKTDARDEMQRAFERWLIEKGMHSLDKISRASLVLYRVRTPAALVEQELLQHRDVRTVDLPPRYRLEAGLLATALAELGNVPSPAENAPSVVVLDSGLATNHPVLGPAVGDAQSFLAPLDASDEHGHGTAVAGLALYGDVAACLEARRFVPELRLHSGRILDATGHNQTSFIENQIAEAVDYFVENYRARVFNISVGDDRKPFVGGHVRGLALTLDELSRTKNVLFVVPAGNFKGNDEPPRWRTEYPRYLLERKDARLLDPAPGINVLTVGALARYEQSRFAQEHVYDPAYPCVARARQPSPFTRTGPGATNAIKPDVADYGGNYAIDLRAGADTLKLDALLGEVSTNAAFVQHGLFADRCGTSFAAPRVAHVAARLLREYPTASPNLLRALLVASADVPAETEALRLPEDDVRRLVGYGRIDPEAATFSSERCVTMIAEESLGEDTHHFYEVPLPEDFLQRRRRNRMISVAIAHTPEVRTTRVDYRASKFSFDLVEGLTLEQVTRVFQKTKKKDRLDRLPEVRDPTVGKTARNRGTVQAARYKFHRVPDSLRTGKLFVVVTRYVPPWAKGLHDLEAYALVVRVEDRSEGEVQLYTQLRQKLQAQVRVRQRG